MTGFTSDDEPEGRAFARGGLDRHFAAVQLGDASSTMNLRQAPTTQSQVVAQLKSGRRLIVCSEADDGGWVRVRTAEYEGYCKLEYLKAE